MITKVSNIEELKSLFIEILLTKTNKVTKIADETVLNGTAYGIAKIGQKALKEIAVIEAHLFPDVAFGSYLDRVSSNFGISGRFVASSSVVYARVVGDPGTEYIAGTHVFSGNHGINFDLQSDFTIGVHGWGYVKLRSQAVGSKTNVDSLSINSVSPVPIGHLYVINEYKGNGGRDLEQDDFFKKRIKEGANILAKNTISMIEQVFMKLNNNVLRVFHYGANNDGKIILAIATQNGVDLTSQELSDLLEYGEEFFSLTEFREYGGVSYGVVLQNVVYYPIDISFRCDILSGYNADNVRKEIQIKLSKYFDYRYWNPLTARVEWDDLLEIVKSTRGVRYVPDTYFTPGVDIVVDPQKLPLIRGFIMMDLDGNIISNVSGTLQPSYYPSNPDFSYWSTVLVSL